MKKNEIIEAIANANVPPGAALVERDTPIAGFRISKIGEGQNELNIFIARLFANQLKAISSHLPEEPNPALFDWLHRSIIAIHESEIKQSTMPILASGVMAEHQKVIGKLREIAGKLGITYKEPEDP